MTTRRGFFGALAGMIAAPIAAKALEDLPKMPEIASDPVEVFAPTLTEFEAFEYATCASYYCSSASLMPTVRMDPQPIIRKKVTIG